MVISLLMTFWSQAPTTGCNMPGSERASDGHIQIPMNLASLFLMLQCKSIEQAELFRFGP